MSRTFSVSIHGKRPPGRARRRWMDNCKLDLTEIGWSGMDWIDMARDKDQRRALNLHLVTQLTWNINFLDNLFLRSLDPEIQRLLWNQ
jgi:hypothetical protein